MIGQNEGNGVMVNTRSFRSKGSGLKSVCNKNTPSSEKKVNVNSKADSIVKMMSQTLAATPHQPSKNKNYEQPNELVLTLFEKCFRPSTETFRLNS